MIAVDTNIVVRLLVRDDPAQAAHATALVRDNRVLLLTSVLLETEWVLRSRYRVPRGTILDGLRRLVGLDQVTLDQPAIATRALDAFAAGLDLADALHLAGSGAATEFATFDRALAHRAGALGLAPPVRLCG
jgi:predicted nucleic-acid-binding protein